MQEVEFARETLRFAQMFLHMGVTNIWLYRMLVGKLYYAAHHLGRRLLIEIGMQPEQWRANVHQRVLNELRRQYVATGRMTLEAWRALNRLLDLLGRWIMNWRSLYDSGMSIVQWCCLLALPTNVTEFWG